MNAYIRIRVIDKTNINTDDTVINWMKKDLYVAFQAEGERILEMQKAKGESERDSNFPLPKPLKFLPLRKDEAFGKTRGEQVWRIQAEEHGPISRKVKRILEKVERKGIRHLSRDDIAPFYDDFPICNTNTDPKEEAMIKLLSSCVGGIHSNWDISIAKLALEALTMSGTKTVIPLLIEVLEDRYNRGDEHTKIDAEVALERITGKRFDQSRWGYRLKASDWKEWFVGKVN